MNLQDILQILGGVGVIASIIYAALQLRDNAKAVRAASVQQLNLSILAQWDEAARDRGFVYLVMRGGDDFNQLSKWDKERFRFFMLARTRRYEVAHFQHLVGNITAEDWSNIFGPETKATFCRPGMRQAWPLIKMRIGPRFRAVIDELLASEEGEIKLAPPKAIDSRKQAGQVKHKSRK